MNSNHHSIEYGIVWCLKDRSGATWEQTTWYETKDSATATTARHARRTAAAGK